MIFLVFTPVWIDIYGGENKNIYLGIFQILTLIGIIAGFLLTNFFIFIFNSEISSFFILIIILSISR